MHETWETFSRAPAFRAAGPQAYAILDRRLLDIPELAARHPLGSAAASSADTLASWRGEIGVDAGNLAATVAAYNAACTGDPRRSTPRAATALPRAAPLQPPKSNWARAIVEPPFLAWPLIGAIAYTFGGLATDDRGARCCATAAPIPGLYAAGEITGHFHGTAPNAVSVLRAFVFGRIAGRRRWRISARGSEAAASKPRLPADGVRLVLPSPL